MKPIATELNTEAMREFFPNTFGKQAMTTPQKNELTMKDRDLIGDLIDLWNIYKKDPTVLYNPNPPLSVVFSFEGFWLWLIKRK